MPDYTLGLFANMYPAFDGDYRGIFIGQMVRDLESRGVVVKKAVKTLSSLLGYAPFLYQSFLLSRDRTPDLFQADYIPHSSLVPAYIGRKGTPLILKFHGDDARIYPFKNPFNMMLTKSMLKRAAHIITGSGEMKRTLVSLGEDPEKISVIHTGVDTQFFTPLDKEECRRRLDIGSESQVFLFVGRLHPWKGVNELVEVARACPDFTFVFLGPGSIPPHTANCQFIGTQLPAMVRLWLNAADCLLLPTYTESVPTAVMEASACGIPAITSDIGGCPEIVEDYKTGLLVPVRNADKLGDAVRWMATHHGERREMGRQARVTATQRYDHNLLTEKLIELHVTLIR